MGAGGVVVPSLLGYTQHAQCVMQEARCECRFLCATRWRSLHVVQARTEQIRTRGVVVLGGLVSHKPPCVLLLGSFTPQAAHEADRSGSIFQG